MKPFLLFAFIQWIFGKMFSKVIKLNKKFRNALEDEPGLAVFGWIVGTIISMAVVSLLGAAFIDSGARFGQFMLAQISIAVLYLTVNGVTIMYKAFKQDRQELFNKLKDTE
jgi:hypothetical protein